MAFRSKRASLQLSINAIVVLILAITILGLGLGFIKSQFTSMTKQFDQVSDEIEKELTDKIRTSGELLVFNKQKIDATRGVEDVFYMGVSNPGSPTSANCFNVLFRCIQTLSGADCDPAGAVPNPAGVGGKAPSGYTITMISEEWFNVFDEVNIEGGDVGVYPVYLQIAGASSDTYLVEIDVFQADAACDASPTWSNTPWQKKQFYIELK
jgi:hypothetical protein